MEIKKLKLIGKGLFSKVYQLNEKEVLIKSEDLVKECLALYIGSKLFPKCEIIDRGLYKMKYYPKVTSLKESLKPAQYKLYRELRELSIGYVKNRHDNYYKWREQFETVRNKNVREQLTDALDELINYGSDISFEISPRNVAVDKGNLILLDCFFFQNQAEKIRNSRTTNRYY